MAISRRSVLIRFVMTAAAALLFAGGAGAADRKKEDATLPFYDGLNDPARLLTLRKDVIIRELGLAPGMTVLDLGAGQGYLTFAIAAALDGTGTVYATDIRASFVDGLKKKAQEEKRPNVFPALVSPAGDDPFYAGKRFDVIVACEVCSDIPDRVSFFAQLRPSLAPETGRLFIIDAPVAAKFSLPNFASAHRILRRIGREMKDTPVYRRLDPALAEYMKKNDLAQPLPERYREMLMDDFNALLAERKFAFEMDGYYASKNYEPRLSGAGYNTRNLMCAWLRYQLAEAGVFDKDESALTGYERQSVSMLNYLILTSVFDREMASAAHYPFASYPAFPVQSVLVRELEAAGYRLVRAHEALPMHYMLEFARTGPEGSAQRPAQ